MKAIIIILPALLYGYALRAQDTVYVSRDKVTALFFNFPVHVTGKADSNIYISQKEDSLITLKARSKDFKGSDLELSGKNDGAPYPIRVQYSNSRAGRSVHIRKAAPVVKKPIKAINPYSGACIMLLGGPRSPVIDHKNAGGIKAWIDELSAAGNQIFFRLNIRNRSNLPYEKDFVRFYLRDLKTAARTATHEQEIIPLYFAPEKRDTVLPGQQKAIAFAFQRFSLSANQALYLELYERDGNRIIYLRLRQTDLDKAVPLRTAPAVSQ